MSEPCRKTDVDTVNIDSKVVTSMLQRFLSLNEKRKAVLLSHSSRLQSDFIDLLPLLFHVNHSTLPGYIEENVPSGILGYHPKDNILHLAKKYAGGFQLETELNKKQDIHAVYLMGSAGSVAYTGQSDLDCWIAYNPDLTTQEFDLLDKKRQAIQVWAKRLGLDVSLYLVNQNRFCEQTDAEGPYQQPGLLLDEFYRTAIYLEGQYLLWWLVPIEWNTQYNAYAEKLLASEYLNRDEWIDFGTVDTIDPQEFINNALWYINKALTSPYKTGLKLVLMESYLSQYPDCKPLSINYKSFIYNYIENTTVIDAYLLMYRTVEDYLILTNQFERLEFIRHCFYQKVSLRSDDNIERKKVGKKIIQELIDEWMWDDAMLVHFNARPTWNLEHIGKEKALYVKQLISSFKRIAGFIRKEHVLFEKNKKYLIRMSRKIAARLELTQGKIEVINISFVPKMKDKHISIARKPQTKGTNLWSLYDYPIDYEDAWLSEPSYQCESLIELLVWSKINGLLNPHTSVQFKDELELLQYDELERLSHKLFNIELTTHIQNDEFYDKEPEVLQIHFFINVAHNQLTQQAKQGIQIMTDKLDPLCYGKDEINLVESIDVLYCNSWGEIFVVNFLGKESLPNCMVALLDLYHRQKKKPKMDFHCFSFLKGDTLKVRVKEVIEHVIQLDFNNTESELNYICKFSNEYRLLHKYQHSFAYSRMTNLDELDSMLVSERGKKKELDFDSNCFSDTFVDEALEKESHGKQKLFIDNRKENIIRFCFIDEFGGLVEWEIPRNNNMNYIQYLFEFIKNMNHQYDSSDDTIIVFECHADEWIDITSTLEKSRSEDNSIAIHIDIEETENGYILNIMAREVTIRLDDDEDLAKKFFSWLDRAFSGNYFNSFIQNINYISETTHHISPSQLMLDKKRLESRLGYNPVHS